MPSLVEHMQRTSEIGDVRQGVALPLGAQPRGDGVNFAIYSRGATGVSLELYAAPNSATPSRSITLDPGKNRTGDVWHVWLKGIPAGQLYAYRMDGPYAPHDGLRFNPHKILLDPFASAITAISDWDFRLAQGFDSSSPDQDLAISTVDDTGAMPKCIVVQSDFDWEDDQPLRRPWSQTVIYETHVRGLTVHPSSGVAHPGTYLGVIEKIPYWQQLGVTAVELMPVQEFNESPGLHSNPITGEKLRDYWGYNPVNYIAPKASYCSAGGMGQQTIEFRQMVKALHQAGIEVLLDVVFTHSAEGDERGPTLSLRGIDNAIFYILAGDKRYYRNFTGTGNAINGNHPVVRGLILDMLRYWVVEMHVDGFRFDLASVLGRDADGNLSANSSVMQAIAEDPFLRNAKIIAEAWDAAGAYQVGNFSEKRWAEWNGKYRDDLRRYWRGEGGLIGALASRIAGSSDLYGGSGKGPAGGINFVTCHDGFTLNDLVSYASKHNEANGENSCDGIDENFSANYGVEGPTNDAAIQARRKRQMKNFLLTLFVSRGTPMLLGGDEFGRTQQGNNNAYCQDNGVSWYDWTLATQNQDLVRFTQRMIAFRRSHPVLSQETFYTDRDIRWLGPDGGAPDWYAPSEQRLGCLIVGQDACGDLCILFNAGASPATFKLPAAPGGGQWRRVADTGRAAPGEIAEPGTEVLLADQGQYQVGPQSSVILSAARTA